MLSNLWFSFHKCLPPRYNYFPYLAILVPLQLLLHLYVASIANLANFPIKSKDGKSSKQRFTSNYIIVIEIDGSWVDWMTDNFKVLIKFRCFWRFEIQFSNLESRQISKLLIFIWSPTGSEKDLFIILMWFCSASIIYFSWKLPYAFAFGLVEWTFFYGMRFEFDVNLLATTTSTNINYHRSVNLIGN